MPESQFGQTPGSLAATLDELVALARHLRATPADAPKRLTRLEGLAQMLRYFTVPSFDLEAEDAGCPIGLNTRCSWHDCSRTWHDVDACLLNFAQRDEPPIWLCRDHHPPLTDGGVRPPGYQPDAVARDALESSRREVLSTITRDQLRVVNTRV